MSVDPDCSPELTAMLGSAIATAISDIPFDGPTASTMVGLIDGEFVINPTSAQKEVSDLALTVASTREKVIMIEAGANEVPEDVMLEAIFKAHEVNQEIIKFIDTIVAECGKEKHDYEHHIVDPEMYDDMVAFITPEAMEEAVFTDDKQTREANIRAIEEKLEERYAENEEWLAQIGEAVYAFQKKTVRKMILKDHKRPDGREIKQIRPLHAEVDCLPRVHGSALFQRGQTQVMTVTTLGSLSEAQRLDGIDVTETTKRYMHHYNFPSYSVGETRPSRGPGRREIGHGALAERALVPVLPSEEEFPYAIRTVSEIMESNGSTSQGSICASSLSLMSAGVPIKAPVAGISVGLVTGEGDDDYIILTDIQGLEDFFGDMDFKVAGTRDGITALQMDIKIDGINREILKEALAQAKKARFEILDVIEKQIAKPREDVSKYAPKTEVFMINPDKIKDVIGRGGEMITKIILECSNVNTVNDINAVKVDLEDDGRVIIYHTDRDIINKTAERIKNIAREVEIGKTYTCKVVNVEDFGIFVELWPGCEGLIHVSQLDTKRVDKPSDLFKVGDEVIAIATGYDKKGKLNLSRKDLLKK